MKKIKLIRSILFVFSLCLLVMVAGIQKETVKADETTFSIKYVSVRYSAEQNGRGLRFAFIMSNEFYNTWSEKDGAKFGAIVVPTDLAGDTTPTLENAESMSAQVVETLKTDGDTQMSDWYDSTIEEGGYKESYIYIYGTPKNAYNRPITVVGYATDGTNTEYTQLKSISLSEAAFLSIPITEEGDEKTMLEGYLNDYTVSFVDADGNNVAAAQTHKYGENWTVPTLTEKTGMEFDGWLLRGDDVESQATWTEIADISTFDKKVTSNIQLKAKYNAIQKNITFKYPTDSAVAQETIVATYGEGLEKAPAAGYNYKFGDAALAVKLNGQFVDGVTVDTFKTITEDTTVEYVYEWTSNNFKYISDAVNGDKVVTTAGKNNLSHFALDKTVTSDGFMFSMDIAANSVRYPIIGLNIYGNVKDVDGGVKSLQMEAVCWHEYHVMDGGNILSSGHTVTRMFYGNTVWGAGDMSYKVAYLDGVMYMFNSEGAMALEYPIDIDDYFGEPVGTEYTIGFGGFNVQPYDATLVTESNPLVTLSNWSFEENIGIIKDYVDARKDDLSQYVEANNNPTMLFTDGNTAAIDANGRKDLLFTKAPSKNIQLSGTFYQPNVAVNQKNKQGFIVTSGSSTTTVWSQFNGVVYNGNYSSNSGVNQYVINTYTNTFTGCDGSPSTKETIDYVAVISNDILYVWFDNVLCWRVPLAAAGSEYTIGFSTDGGQTNTITEYRNTTLLIGDDAIAANANYLTRAATVESYYNLYDATMPNKGLSIAEDGSIYNPSNNTANTNQGQVYFKTGGSSLTYNATSTWEDSATVSDNGTGIVLFAGSRNNFRMITLTGNGGFQVVGGSGWDVSAAAASWSDDSTDKLRYGSYGATYANGSGTFMTDAAIDAKGKAVVWIISNGVLYVEIDNTPYFKLNLSEFGSAFGATTNYRLGVAVWNRKDREIVISNISISNDATEAATEAAKFTTTNP